jgi:hypothetical protein
MGGPEATENIFKEQYRCAVGEQKAEQYGAHGNRGVPPGKISEKKKK